VSPPGRPLDEHRRPQAEAALACERRVRAACLRWLALATLLVLTACASPRLDVPRPVSHALPATDDLPLVQAFQAQRAEHPGESGFQLLSSGHAAFASRIALADMAASTLDLQYYSVGDDLTTDLMLDRLAAAAARGVRVRVLLDDVDAGARAFARRASALHANIQVRLFNPFLTSDVSAVLRIGEFLLDGERLNRRMHNKLWVADNAVAILGSRNLGDAYFDSHSAANFVDIDLLASGPIVAEMSRSFDAYWNSVSAWPVAAFGVPDGPGAADEARAALDARLARCRTEPPCHWVVQVGLRDALRSGQIALSWGPAVLSFDPPDGAKLDVPGGIAHAGHSGHAVGRPGGELLVVSPYFIPEEDGLAHLAAMREGGDRIAVLTNSLASTDSTAAHAGYSARRQRLLEQGVALYEIRPTPGRRHGAVHRWGKASPGSLHAKFIVQDRRHVVIGSRNQDPRSRRHNTEAWLTVDSPELAADLAALFDEGIEPHHAYRLALHPDREGALAWLTEEDGAVVRHDAEPEAGMWLRLWRAVLSAVLPEHLL
jgi:cardiolipin synthase C